MDAQGKHLEQKGRRVPGEPHLGAGRARGQPDLSSLLPVARPRALRGGSHSPATPATWMRTKPNRRARATAAWGQGTRGPLGVAMSRSWRRGLKNSAEPRRLEKWGCCGGWAGGTWGCGMNREGCGEPRVCGSSSPPRFKELSARLRLRLRWVRPRLSSRLPAPGLPSSPRWAAPGESTPRPASSE